MSKQTLVLFALAALVAVSVALNVRDRAYIEFSEPRPVPEGWERVGDAPRNHAVNMTFAVKNRNLDQLTKLFWERTNPQNPTWTQWLNAAEIHELTAPAPEVVATLRAWLLAGGASNVKVVGEGDFLVVETTVEVAQSLLNTRFSSWRHSKTGRAHVTALGPYSAPAPLAAHIDFISGVWGFPTMQPRADFKTPLGTEVGNPAVVPADLLSAYNCTYKATYSNSSMAVAEFQAQFYSPTDLSDFFERYVPGETPAKVNVLGTNFPNSPGIEASLDIEYIMGVAPTVPKVGFLSVAGFNFWNDLTTWVTYLDSGDDVEFVHSVSYGDQRMAQQPSDDYKNRLNTEFQKAGLRGLSIIFASGDSGAGCSLCTQLEPSFPATSPYVTSVGATRFLNGLGSEEGAVESFKSGGGFSRTFPLSSAPYQESVVNKYLNSAAGLPPSTDYNGNGRGTPDVAALGIGYTVIAGGRTELIGGTSASTPTFSALITLLNDMRFNQGKTSLGFLNNWIYQTDAADNQAFTDITVGENAQACCQGFPCTSGWDPVTGVGTPNFGVLTKYI